MKIGELAKTTDTRIETIRYYEREGLLPKPGRSGANYRIYDKTHAQRLSFIRHCRALDMNLEKIRVLLRLKDVPAENCAEVNALLDEHIAHVGMRMRELRSLGRELRTLRDLCRVAQDVGRCGILNELSNAVRSPAPPFRFARRAGARQACQATPKGRLRVTARISKPST